MGAYSDVSRAALRGVMGWWDGMDGMGYVGSQQGLVAPFGSFWEGKV